MFLLAVVLILDLLLIALIGLAVFIQVTNEERARKILEYTVAYLPLSIREFTIVRGLGMTIILLILALIGISIQLLWLYISLAIGIDMVSLCLLILSTATLITGLTLLGVTIPMLIPSRYVQLVTLAIVAAINIVFFIAIRSTTLQIESLSMSTLLRYNLMYIALGLAITLATILLVKRYEDRIALNIITSD